MIPLETKCASDKGSSSALTSSDKDTSLPTMDEDYYSISSILADTHVSANSQGATRSNASLTCQMLNNCFRNSHAHSIKKSQVWASWKEGPMKMWVNWPNQISAACHLTNYANGQQIKEHAKLELPFWLAQTLSVK